MSEQGSFPAAGAVGPSPGLELLVVEDGPLALPVRAVPPGWTWSRTPARQPLGGADAGTAPLLVLVLGPTPGTVAGLRSRFPAAGLLALVERDASMACVVEVLEAGADTCVRSADPRLLSAHLAALAARARRCRALAGAGGAR